MSELSSKHAAGLQELALREKVAALQRELDELRSSAWCHRELEDMRILLRGARRERDQVQRELTEAKEQNAALCRDMEDTIKVCRADLAAALKRNEEHEMFRHQHRDCDKMGVELQKERASRLLADDTLLKCQNNAIALMYELKEAKAKYHELLLAVSDKTPYESRHETALRYIREREYSASTGAAINEQKKDKP